MPFRFAGQSFEALGSGALWWPSERALLVADLHLGRPDRMARRGGALLPPQGDAETLERLTAAIEAVRPARVISLGDAFDDAAGPEGLLAADAAVLRRLQPRADWTWIAGNHEGLTTPGFGTALAEWHGGGIAARHVARPGAGPDISGHYHPKARLAGRLRPVFLVGAGHLILPAFGAYTGGMDCTRAPLPGLTVPGLGIVTGAVPRAFPLR
ncbi:ligase-associated DNA damage response endonuclease PdeM [Acidimangrovimonas sediminis]|uniref:ligase-associated DNA damage response endonuclease PdeM n=1 Tax=Acidimangrovimonas sediminis TaxID=2056283 RepID=UPI0038B8B3B6